MLRISLPPLLATMLLLAAGAPPAGATWSDQHNAIPGAAASAGFNGKLYIFARDPDNSLKYRTADGLIYSDWTPLPIGGGTANYPAAATATDGSFLALFRRGTGTGNDNSLYASRTFNGTDYEDWRNLGGALSAAPSAVGFKGCIHVFARAINNELYTGCLEQKAATWEWKGWFHLGGLPLGGKLSAAPVATVMRRADGQSQIVVIVRNAADSKLYQRTSADGSSFTPWFKRSETTLAINPNDQADFPIVTDLGFNFISPGYPKGSWETYKLPVFSTAQAQLAKFNLVYNSTFPKPVFSACHIQSAIDRGAITIILRLADTKISPGEVDQQLNEYLIDPDPEHPCPRVRVLDIIAANPYRQFWIEVGNEPNLRGMSPYDVRKHLLHTIQQVAPKYRTSHSHMRWMASLPTRHGGLKDPNTPKPEDDPWYGLRYLDIVLSDKDEHGTIDGLGTILAPDQYEALGIHMFGAEMLQQGFPKDTDNGRECTEDGDCPTVVLDRVLAMTAKTIFITEAGMNRGDWPWYFVDANQPGKATYHIRAMRRLPAQVRGYVVWAADLDPVRCKREPGAIQPKDGYYSFDATYDPTQDDFFCTPDPHLRGSQRFNAR